MQSARRQLQQLQATTTVHPGQSHYTTISPACVRLLCFADLIINAVAARMAVMSFQSFAAVQCGLVDCQGFNHVMGFKP